MKIRKFMALAVATVLLTICSLSGHTFATPQGAGTATAATDSAPGVVQSKSEVVYATLTAQGELSGTYIVNHFEVETGGLITDYGDYTSVHSLTADQPLTQTGNAYTFDAPEGHYYYQGNMDGAQMPWIFTITYALDGVEQSAQAVAGQSGRLEMGLSVQKNLAVAASFFENYMLQISLSLGAETCKLISAPDATVAEAGGDKRLTFTVLPGKEAHYVVTADVNDFSMSGIEIAAMPFSMNMDLPDTASMTDGFSQLPKAIADLSDGAGKLSGGAQDLYVGFSDLRSGSSTFKNGLGKLKGSGSQLTDGSAQIENALKTITSSLQKAGSTGQGGMDLSKLPEQLPKMSGGLLAMADGLTKLKTGFSSAYTALDKAIASIPANSVTEEQIRALYAQVDKSQHAVLDKLVQEHAAAQTVKGTYGQVKQAFDAVAPTIDELTGQLRTMAASIDEMGQQLGVASAGQDVAAQMEQLTRGLVKLTGEYETFDDGLNSYVEGINKLSDGYGTFDAGFSTFGSGLRTFRNGMTEWRDGAQTLSDEVSKMPAKIQEEIDNLVGEYTERSYVATSFASEKNEKVNLVQFVFKCEGIKGAQTDAYNDADTNKPAQTVWERFVALFSKQ